MSLLDGGIVGERTGTITAIDSGTGVQTITVADGEVELTPGVNAIQDPVVGTAVLLLKLGPRSPWISPGRAVAQSIARAKQPDPHTISGVTEDGEELVIAGTGFYEPVGGVTVDGDDIAPEDITFISPTEIRIVKPVHAPGVVAVAVSLEGVEVEDEDAFTFL